MRPTAGHLACWLVILWCWVGAARADSSTGDHATMGVPARIVILRDPSPAGEALFSRVRGQLSDVDAEIVVKPPLEGATLAAQAQEAFAIGRQSDARVIVWFAEATKEHGEEAGLLVCLADPRGASLYLRQACASPTRGREPPDDRTGCWETAALIARTAVRALLDGGAIGIAGRTVHLAPHKEKGGLRATQPEPTSWQWRLAMGPSLALDGHTRRGQAGITGGIAAGRGASAIEFRAATTAPATVADRQVWLSLTQTLGEAVGWYQPWERDGKALALGLGAGIVRFARTTEYVAPGAGVVAAPSRSSWSPLLAVHAVARIAPMWARGLGLAVMAGANLVPGAPTLLYAGVRGDAADRQLWRVQPFVAVQVELTSKPAAPTGPNSP